MPRKKQQDPLPKEVKSLIDRFTHSLSEQAEGKVLLPSVIEYLMKKLGYTGCPEIKPIFVASSHAPKVVLGTTTKTWSNWRACKKGPKFWMDGGRPYYKISDIEEHFSRCPVETSNHE